MAAGTPAPRFLSDPRFLLPIGVGTTGCLPGRSSLRTVRAVFPHTALRSVVLPPRGLTSRCMGCNYGEQPLLGKEGIRPALMVLAPAATTTLGTAAKDAAKPHPDPLVQRTKRGVMTVFEVHKPARKGPVDSRNDYRKAKAVGALRFAANGILQLLQAFGTGPTIAALKVVPKKVETTTTRSIDNVRLLRMEGQSRRLGPALDQTESGLRFGLAAAQNHKVVSIAYHGQTRASHQMIQGIEIDIRQQWTYDRTLRGAKLGGPALSSVQDLLLKKALNKAEDTLIANLQGDTAEQLIVPYRVEVGFEVGIHHVREALSQECTDATKRVLTASPRSETVTMFGKIPLEDRFKDLAQRGLHDSISYRGNPQWTALFLAGFGYPHASDGLWPVGAGPEFRCKLFEVTLKLRLEVPDRHMIHPRTPTVGLHTRKGRPKIRRSMDLVHQAVPRTSFHPVFQGCQHAVCPDCGFDPGPAVPYRSGPSSPEGHCSRFVFPLSVHHASTFLPPFAPRPLRRFSATMEALTPVRVSIPHRSPRLTYSTVLTIPSPTTWCPPVAALHPLRCSQRDRSPISRPFAFCISAGHRQNRSRLRTWLAGSPRSPCRNGFVNLRTGRSPPVALHPASQRRSYRRLQAVALT